MEYFVSTNGIDTNVGDEAHPWRTIQKAANTLTAGSTVQIKGGTYNEAITPKNTGVPGIPIIYKAYQNDTVIIDGAGITRWEGLLLVQAKAYLQFYDFYLKNAAVVTYEAGVYLDHCDHILLQNMDITGSSISGILANRGTNINAIRCHVHGTNTEANHEMISFVGVNGFEIAYCDVHDPASARRCLIDAKVGCRNGIIHHNLVHGAVIDGGIGIYVDGGYTSPVTDTINIEIFCNVVYDMITNSVAISLSVETGDANMVNIQIRNNIVFNCQRAFTVAQTNGSEKINFTLAYNIFYNNKGSEIFITASPGGLNNCVVSSNIGYHVGSSGYLCVLGPNYAYTYSQYASTQLIIDNNIFFSNVGSYPTQNQLGTNVKKQDPLFVNAANGDFHLRNGSPAIDAGSSEYAPANDFDGVPRPFGIGFDIGAYEEVNNMAYDSFSPGVNKTANVVLNTDLPQATPGQIEVWLGPDKNTKTVTSGKKAFTSPAPGVNSAPIACPVTMPAVGGTYKVFIDLFDNAGVYLAGWVNAKDVLIFTGTAGLGWV